VPGSGLKPVHPGRTHHNHSEDHALNASSTSDGLEPVLARGFDHTVTPSSTNEQLGCQALLVHTATSTDREPLEPVAHGGGNSPGWEKTAARRGTTPAQGIPPSAESLHGAVLDLLEHPDPHTAAEAAAVDNLLRCWVREAGLPAPGSGVLRIPLPASGTALLVPVHYWSPTGWHRFGLPHLAGAPDQSPPTDAVTIAVLLGRETSAVHTTVAATAGDPKSTTALSSPPHTPTSPNRAPTSRTAIPEPGTASATTGLQVTGRACWR
jgi:hypothetical protein